jgi:uncharacterized protein (DUF1501 family)
MTTSKQWTRRDFLHAALATATGVAARRSALGLLAATHSYATEAASTDYKALVCIMLSGGNDGFNLLIPTDDRYATYKTSRANLALPLESISSLNTTPSGLKYGIHPQASGLRNLYNQGQLAFLANVGTLLEPTTKKKYQAGTNLPPQLYSHYDQSDQTMSAQLDALQQQGWGGRIADLMTAKNGTSKLPLGISVAGNNLFQTGATRFSYNLNPYRNSLLSVYSADPQNARYKTFNKLLTMAEQDKYVLKRQLATGMKSSAELGKTVVGALEQSSIGTGIWPGDSVAQQLQTIAKVISVREKLGMSRQVFYVQHNGYDTHYNQLELHAKLLAELSNGLAAFYTALNQFGVADSVTSFTLSDFGRTLSSNGEGSDHAWGNVQLIAGGAVAGGDVYGQFPNQTLDGPDDGGHGRLIPTTSIEQYGATLAKWFGVNADGLKAIFPHLERFPIADLGFMRS